jgi:hypothetical protein
MKRSAIAGLVCIGVVLLFTMPMLAMHVPKNRTSHLTFSHPVRVPGATLPAGAYTFSLLNPGGHRGIVRITSRNGDKVFATILTISDYRTKATPHTVILFGEKGGHEEATPIKAWFYPHAKYGYRFVYPRDEAAEIAAACNEPVPETLEQIATTTELTPDQVIQLEKTPVSLVTPAKQDEKYDVAELSTGDKGDQGGFDAEP